MSLWLQYCLNHPSDLSELLEPQIVINPEDLVSNMEIPSFVVIAHEQPQLQCALGWWLYDLDGITVCRHTGSSFGMQSVLAIIPEKGIGVVIPSNQSKHPAVSALMNLILDNLLERPEVDWKTRGMEALAETEKIKKSGLKAVFQTIFLKPFLCEFLLSSDAKKITGLTIKDMGVFDRVESFSE